MSRIKDLCLEYTDLSIEDITQLEHVENHLQFIANSAKADVFIDCPTKEADEAIIVAEAKPTNTKSLYINSFVGQMALRESEPATLRTLELGVTTTGLKALIKREIAIKQSVDAIKNNQGKVIGALIVEENIDNEDKNVLQNTKMNMSDLYEFDKCENENDNVNDCITSHIYDAIMILDEEGVVRFRNPVAEELYKNLGYRDNILGMDFSNISLEDIDFNKLIDYGEDRITEVSIGKYFFKIKYTIEKCRNFRVIMVINDITSIKQKEHELVLKSVAIKEIHHRVKNNLQTIASLLRVQSRKTGNLEVKKILSENIGKILSIASTHEILAKEGMDKISIQEMLGKIIISVNSCFNEHRGNITIDISGDDFEVNSGKATDIALIISELLNNSLEHAFIGFDIGSVSINIKIKNGYCTITFVDDGIGFDVDSVSDESLGIGIVKSLINEKLKGTFKIESNKFGTNIKIHFKN